MSAMFFFYLENNTVIMLAILCIHIASVLYHIHMLQVIGVYYETHTSPFKLITLNQSVT
jgi:hypothetical protein